MRKLGFFIIILIFGAASSAVYAGSRVANEVQLVDSIYIYESWQAMFNNAPDTMVTNVKLEPNSAYDIAFKPMDSKDTKLSNILANKTVALALGDTTWFINGNYLKRNFPSDGPQFKNYVPLFFSAKIAFIQYKSVHNGPSFGSVLLNVLVDGIIGADSEIGMDGEEDNKPAPLYLLNFTDKKIELIDEKVMSRLLEPYMDLRRRYESMRDYKETYMINNFFLQYVDRLNDDDSVPFLF
jgi:hypothetical protein